MPKGSIPRKRTQAKRLNGLAHTPIPADRLLPTEVEQLRTEHTAVTDQQAKLVFAVLVSGWSIKRICKHEGWSEQWGYATMQKQHVVAYRQAMAMMSLGWVGLDALTTMKRLLTSPKHHIRFEAAKDLMDRAGLTTALPQSGSTHNVTVAIKL